MENKGLILINTGNGKGKTTAALGTAIRAWGDGQKVLILQFIKGGWKYGELNAIQALNKLDQRLKYARWEMDLSSIIRKRMKRLSRRKRLWLRKAGTWCAGNLKAAIGI